MASGSQTNSGIWALLPVAPMNRRMQTHRPVLPSNSASVSGASSVVKSSPNGPSVAAVTVWKMMNIASRKAKSPIRLTMNALLAAAEFLRSVYQNPISR